MKKFDIPEIPYEYAAKARLKIRKVWAMEDLDLCDPAIFIQWNSDELGGMPTIWDSDGTAKRMVEDPAFDLAVQLRHAARSLEFMTAGDGFCNQPGINLLHFGTGALATAFGARAVFRDCMPAFEPAVHTAEEAMRLKKPNLFRDGMCQAILDRIDFYNEATRGRIQIQLCDTAGPWSIATQIWHYEDMLEAIHAEPEAVHRFLDLVTECMIEFIHIQLSAVGNNGFSLFISDLAWANRGWYLGDDVLVTVSPAQYREFFKPYNELISKEFGGVICHCCGKHEHQLENMADLRGFMGLDARPECNSVETIEKVLSGKGVWVRRTSEPEYIDRFRGKAGLFLQAGGDTKQAALDHAARLKEYLAEKRKAV